MTPGPQPRRGDFVTCNNCAAPIDVRQPLYTCLHCIGDRVPSDREFLCERCRTIHQEAHHECK